MNLFHREVSIFEGESNVLSERGAAEEGGPLVPNRVREERFVDEEEAS